MFWDWLELRRRRRAGKVINIRSIFTISFRSSNLHGHLPDPLRMIHQDRATDPSTKQTTSVSWCHIRIYPPMVILLIFEIGQQPRQTPSSSLETTPYRKLHALWTWPLRWYTVTDTRTKSSLRPTLAFLRISFNNKRWIRQRSPRSRP